jgi:glycosyltransferase involved in cell wall biosynthesis
MALWKKMKVLIICEDNIDRPTGGLGVFLGQLVKFMLEKGDMICISSAGGKKIDTPNLKIEPWKSSPVTVFGSKEITLLQESLVACTISAAYFMKERFDFILAFDTIAGMVGHKLSDALCIPYVYYSCLSFVFASNDFISSQLISLTEIQHEMLKIYDTEQIKIIMSAKHIITVSKDYAKRFPPLFWSKMTVIPNGLNHQDWSNPYTPFAFPEKSVKTHKKCLYIGRYAQMKGVMHILDAEIPKDMELYFAGDQGGGDRQLFTNMLDFVKNTDRSYYLGYVTGAEKINLFNSVDFILMPSIHEPFGIVALEALAAGKILITTRRNGLSEFVPESSIIDCSNSRGFTDGESITKALQFASSLTRDYMKSIAEQNKKIAQTFNNDRIFDFTRKLFISLL